MDDIRARLMRERETLQQKIQSKKQAIAVQSEGHESRNSGKCKSCHSRSSCNEPYRLMREKEWKKKNIEERKKSVEDVGKAILNLTQGVKHNSNWYMFPDSSDIQRKVKLINTSKHMETKMKEQVDLWNEDRNCDCCG
eukprot:TRINITY_DN3635_c0_g1_i11.p2 TRINITY_DN3635_c0_g1~~TRINITY_DN3635_c0_g1_i11.p2  ORF type:complete len:138 (-),score=34.39 TRINITY_DN3635_c0_g1_i11:452-865(-)